MTRRKFLVAGAATVILAFTGWAYAEEFSYEHLIVAVLKRRLDYLTLEDDSLHRFAHDFANDYGTIGYKGELLALGLPLLPIIASLEAEEIEEFEDRVVTRYLMSTDFFRNGPDESRPLHYVAYYEPYSLACANPFARFDETT